MIGKYGYLVLLMLQKDFEEEENYEACYFIKTLIESYNNKLSCSFPTIYYDNMLEDYQLSFWKLGLPGEIALNNLPFFKEKAKKEILTYLK